MKKSRYSEEQIVRILRITGPRPEDIKCFKSWNDECDIALRDGPLKPSEYKILDD